MTIQGDVEIDRNRQAFDGIVNQDRIAQIILDQKYVNGHSALKMNYGIALDARNSLNRI